MNLSIELTLNGLDSHDANVRVESAEQIADLGPAGAEAVPRLIELLTDTERPVSKYAAIALGRIGPKAAAAIPQLLSLLRCETANDTDRRCYATALGEIGPEAIPALTAALRDNDPFVRSQAASAAQYVSDSQTALIQPLVELLKEEEWDVWYYASGTLALFGHRALDDLMRASQSLNAMESIHAARTILRIDPHNRHATGTLVGGLKNSDAELRS